MRGRVRGSMRAPTGRPTGFHVDGPPAARSHERGIRTKGSGSGHAPFGSHERSPVTRMVFDKFAMLKPVMRDETGRRCGAYAWPMSNTSTLRLNGTRSLGTPMHWVSRCQGMSAVAGTSGDARAADWPGLRAKVALQTTVSMNASGRGRQKSDETATDGAEVMRTRGTYHPCIVRGKVRFGFSDLQRAAPNRADLDLRWHWRFSSLRRVA